MDTSSIAMTAPTGTIPGTQRDNKSELPFGVSPRVQSSTVLYWGDLGAEHEILNEKIFTFSILVEVLLPGSFHG